MKYLFALLLFVSPVIAQTTLQQGGNGGQVTGIVVSITPTTIPVGNISQGSAQAIVAGSLNVDITSGGIWSSSNTAVAYVSNGSGNGNCSSPGIFLCPVGQVFGVNVGTANITFTQTGGAFAQTVPISVGSAPQILQTGMTNCPPSGTLCTLPGGFNATGYTYTFSATGGTGTGFTWTTTLGSFAGCGLTLASGGVLSGTAITGTCNATVQVTDSGSNSTSLAVSVVIAPTGGGGGPPNYLAYSGQQVIGVTTSPVLGTATNTCHLPTSWNTSCNNGAVVQDTSYNTYANVPTANLSNITRCTDPASLIGSPDADFSAGQGGAGFATVVSSDSKIAKITAAGTGGSYMTAIVSSGGALKCAKPTGSGAASGIFVTLDQNTVTPGSSTTAATFGNGQFDFTTPGLWWVMGGAGGMASSSITQVYPITFNTTTGSYSYPNVGGTPTPSVDFVYGLPMGANAPEVPNAAVPIGFGLYRTHTLNNLSSLRPEYNKWVASTAYALGDLIVPGDSDGNTTNPNACAYKVTKAGTSCALGSCSGPGGNFPQFGSQTTCIEDAHTDGTVTWKGIASQAKFIVQVTTAGNLNAGVLSPYYGTPPIHPDMGSTFNDGTATFTNVGPNYVPTVNSTLYSSGFGVSIDNHKFGAVFSTNTYGGYRCLSGDCYGYATAGQDTGIWVIHADTNDPNTGKPTFHLMNMFTGIQSNFVCGTGTLGTCGSITQATYGTVPFNAQEAADGINLACPDFLHSGMLYKDGGSYEIGTSIASKTPPTGCLIAHDKEWLPEAAFDPWVNLQFASDGINHGMTGTSHMFDFHNCGEGATSGVYTCIHPRGNFSGNFGGLPTGCGANTSTACLSCTHGGGTDQSCPTGNQPTYSLPPYGFSLAGQCSNSIATTNPTPYTNGVLPMVYGYGATPTGTPWNTTGTNATACNLANTYDNHMGLYNPGLDDHAAMALGSVYNDGNANSIPSTAWQGEEVAMQLFPDPGTPSNPPYPAAPVAAGKNYRFTHTFNCNNNNIFSGQFTISEAAQDGTFLAWTTDNCSPINALGQGATGPQTGSLTNTGVPVQDTSSELGHLPVASVPASILAFQGPVWQSTFPYVTGNIICAIQGSTGGGSHFDCFQAVTGGTSGATQPSFKTSNSPTAHVSLTAGTITGTTATVSVNNTCPAAQHGLPAVCIHVGQNIVSTGNTPSAYNCAYPGCAVTAASSTSISYTIPSGSGNLVNPGTLYGVGSQFTDGTVTWQDIGYQNGRVDVYLVTLK